MTDESHQLQVSTVGDVVIAELSGKLLFPNIISRTGDQLRALIVDRDEPRMVLDLAGLLQLSSRALGMLVTLHTAITRMNGELRLCNVPPAICKILKITRLDEVLHVHPSRDEALESIRS